MTCDAGRAELLNWGVGRPPVSAVVRDPPVECGPDVAPRSRAWKARPGSLFSRDASPMAQLSAAHDRPLLTVSDRQLPVLRARGGHSRRDPSWLRPGGDGHKFNQRLRPVHDATCSLARAPGGCAGSWSLDISATKVTFPAVYAWRFLLTVPQPRQDQGRRWHGCSSCSWLSRGTNWPSLRATATPSLRATATPSHFSQSPNVAVPPGGSFQTTAVP
jgi:hypothetical protein